MSAKDPAQNQDEHLNDAAPHGDLAAAIHETTNMMTVVLGWLARASAEATNPSAMDALEHATRYTRSSRNIMRRAIGASIPAADPEPAGRVVGRAVDDLAIAARDAGVQLSAEIDDAISSVMLPQPDVAWQILTNLMLNGIAVTVEGGQVSVEAHCTNNTMRFRVIDEGPGVPDSVRTSLFSGHSRRQGGAGIGLRHSKALANSSGGSLELIETDSDGACFELSWPTTNSAAPIGAKPAQRNSSPPISLASTRVLLLEDDPAVVQLLELSLRARGADLTVVGKAGELFDALAGRSFDAVLVDLSPLSGALDEACSQARANNPDINIVVISGSVTVKPREDVVWVRKPFEPRELVRAIARSWQSD